MGRHADARLGCRSTLKLAKNGEKLGFQPNPLFEWTHFAASWGCLASGAVLLREVACEEVKYGKDRVEVAYALATLADFYRSIGETRQGEAARSAKLKIHEANLERSGLSWGARRHSPMSTGRTGNWRRPESHVPAKRSAYLRLNYGYGWRTVAAWRSYRDKGQSISRPCQYEWIVRIATDDKACEALDELGRRVFENGAVSEGRVGVSTEPQFS